MIFLIQRRNLLESVRPELVLPDCERLNEGEGDAAHDVLCFPNIRNVGRGAAMHVNINLDGFSNPPTATLGTITRPLLAPNEGSEVVPHCWTVWQLG